MPIPNILIISVVPSPYQRDLFLALNDRPELHLQVHYLEAAAPDSPWELEGLRSYESVIPGYCIGKGQVRSHINWSLPSIRKADLVILNTSITDVTTQWLVRRLKNKAWIFWAEIRKSQRVGWKQRVSHMLYRPLRNATALIGIGSGAQEAYRELFPDQRVYNVPYHIQCPPGKLRRAPSATVNFLFCGQMIHRKAVDVLLAAFSTVIKEGHEARLQMVGREADLKAFLDDVPEEVQARIDCLGFRQPAELPAIFAAADVFVLPSRRDGWGVVINQAVSAGLPIIASDAVGAARDLLIEGENGFCVKAGDVQSLAKAMIALAGNGEMRQQFGAASLAMGESIAPKKGAKKMANIIGEVLGLE